MNADADLVVAFLNTFDVETGSDELATAESWAAWAAERDLPPAGQLVAARAARAALRETAATDATDITDVTAATDVTVPVMAGVVDGQPATIATDAVGAVLLAAARLAAAGGWPRIKLCAAERCRWAFLDESRNHSRAWCSMDVCGNRAKARAFRARNRKP